MKDVGLVGVPFSGKSTLFTAMTRAGSQGGQANIAVVPVPDPRLQVLTDMETSKKTVAAQVRFASRSLRHRAGAGGQEDRTKKGERLHHMASSKRVALRKEGVVSGSDYNLPLVRARKLRRW